ncbi:MAG: enoyl-CoA hydratase/isomerase family protein [Acidimicrobiales bacterium]
MTTAEQGPTASPGVTLDVDDDFVATIELHRPPHNFFSIPLLLEVCDALDAVAADPDARAVVLCSEGRNFCAGAEFGGDRTPGDAASGGPDLHLYDLAVRIFASPTPIVAALNGAAIGGGLGLACAADFRVGGPGSRLSANFARLGFHHGFGLSVTLPAIVGNQRALELLYTGRRIDGPAAAEIGLLDRLVDDERIRAEAHDLAAEIAASAPLAVASIRATMRGHLPDAIRAATDRERAEQERLGATNDWREGVAAMAERRDPNFTGT